MRSIGASDGTKRATLLVVLSLGVLLHCGPAGLADEPGEDADSLLAAELVTELGERCDASEIYQRAWQDILSSEEYTCLPHDEQFEYQERLREAVTPILLACFEKEMNAFTCEGVPCGDATAELKGLSESLGLEYFFGDILGCYTRTGYQAAWAAYQAKLERCYVTLFARCDCDMYGLLDLWSDLALNDLNFLDGAVRMDLADRVLAKFEDCLVSQIQTMTNVYEMARLIFDDPDDIWTPYSKRGIRNTMYNNYTMACAILKRLVELYDLDVEEVDRYLCSSCCDTVWLVGWLLDWIDHYHLMGYPERDWREWSSWDQDNLNHFRQQMHLAGDLYTVCRKRALEEATVDCDPTSFCRILACREHGVAGYREALEAQLDDPREAKFLEAFKTRLEECLGERVEFEDVLDWCVAVPANKTWESLREAGGEDASATTTVPIGPVRPEGTPDSEPPSEPGSTPTTPAIEIAIPQEIVDCARILAWKGGQLSRTDPSQRWDASEDDPGGYCEPCGHTPMCVVCMEWDLGEWQVHRRKSITDVVALMTVLSYLAQVSGQPEYQAVASIYWSSHWDGWHNRDRPW
jgi:hypothetical protein